MRDVREECLLAAAGALDLLRHVVEGAAQLGYLARTGHRNARTVLAAREPTCDGDEVAERPRDRAREQAGHDEREARGDDRRHDERWDEDA